MKVVAIGDKVASGRYHFHSRFTHVVNYRGDGCIISFVDSDTNLSGHSLHVTELPGGEHPVQVFPSHVTVDRAHIPRSKARLYDSSFGGFPVGHDFTPLMNTMRAVLDQNAPELSLAVLFNARHAHSFASSFERVVLDRFLLAYALMKRGDVVGAVEQFRGVGFGLTPSGDDFITGLLYALSSLPNSERARDLTERIMAKVAGCSALSYQFMCNAAAGVYSKDIKELFASARHGDERGVHQHLMEILGHGHSSGADTIAGMIAGFEWFLAQQDSEPGNRIRG